MYRYIKLCGVLALGLSALSAAAQDYPTRVVKFIVPAAPGGTTDMLARALSQRLSDLWKQPVIVENRAGANGSIAAEGVAKSPPDGYTLFVSESSAFVINPHLYKKLSYDGLSDFTPITIIGAASPVIAVNASFPANSVGELLVLSKARPGAVRYGSMGNGSYVHIAMEDFKRRTGVDLTHVPYKSSAPATSDAVAGQIEVVMGTISNYKQFAKAGKLKILAAATPQRLKAYPELKTVAESGVPGWSANTWFGLVGPAKMDEKLRDKIYQDVTRVLNSQEFQAQVLTANDIELVKISPMAFGKQMKTESDAWRGAVKQSGATLD